MLIELLSQLEESRNAEEDFFSSDKVHNEAYCCTLCCTLRKMWGGELTGIDTYTWEKYRFVTQRKCSHLPTLIHISLFYVLFFN